MHTSLIADSYDLFITDGVTNVLVRVQPLWSV